MILYSGLQILLTAYLSIFVLNLFAYSVASMVRRRPTGPGGAVGPRFLLIIPAHDEEAGIRATIESAKAIDYPRDLYEILVIADNCTDATARIARDAGAEVFERSDAHRRSKGFAIEDLLGRLASTGEDARFEAVVVVDADTRMDADLLRVFARGLAGGADWMQGFYSVSNADSTWRTRLMTYAFSLFNGICPLGQGRLGLSSPLRGNGMCFSMRGLRRFPWQASGLVEDLEFSWRLRIAGERVHFLPEAKVFGEIVSRGGEGAVNQRQRWEVGRKSLRRAFTGPLVRAGSLGLAEKAAYLVDLYSPPLARLGSLACAITILNLVVFGRFVWIDLSLCLLLACYLASPFVALGLGSRHALSLLYAPGYALWKATLVLRKGPDRWVRTQRE